MEPVAALGCSFITSSVCGSSPRAIAGRLSVSKLIKSKCTGANGTGSPARDAAKTVRMAPRFPDNKNSMACKMF